LWEKNEHKGNHRTIMCDRLTPEEGRKISYSKLRIKAGRTEEKEGN